MRKFEGEEMHHVKNVKEGRGGWIINKQQPGQVWESEGLHLLKYIGRKTRAILASKLSIYIIAECNNWHCTPRNIDAFLKGAIGWTRKRKADNPYEEHSGEGWRDVIRNTTNMKKYASINVLAKHMYNKTEMCTGLIPIWAVGCGHAGLYMEEASGSTEPSGHSMHVMSLEEMGVQTQTPRTRTSFYHYSYWVDRLKMEPMPLKAIRRQT
eukprot:9383759-Ditylum_brightwellii.AAC.1